MGEATGKLEEAAQVPAELGLLTGRDRGQLVTMRREGGVDGHLQIWMEMEAGRYWQMCCVLGWCHPMFQKPSPLLRPEVCRRLGVEISEIGNRCM